jgi:hypothetical protein
MTYPALPHSLPFRTFFGEYRARRPEQLAKAVLRVIRKPQRIPEDLADPALAHILKSARSSEHLAETAAKRILQLKHGTGEVTTAVAKHILKLELTPQDIEGVWARLDADIARSEQAYRDLESSKQFLQGQRQAREEPNEDFKKRLVDAYEKVLLAEIICQIYDWPLKSILHEMEGTALCLSGGGIRSASFSLGVLEGLARFSRRTPCNDKQPLMDTLDYLSTVSGGGYIGSWLMAWAQRSDYHQVVDQLAASAPTSGDPEPQPIRHLREYTSYLSPRYGFTLDTLTLGSIVVRNMILNWLILVPLVMALFCLPEFLYEVSYAWAFAHRDSGGSWLRVVMGLAIFCVAFASATAVWRMSTPQFKPTEDKSGKTDPEKEGSTFIEVLLFALPVMLSAWLLGEASFWAYVNGLLNDQSVMHVAGWLIFYTLVPPLTMSLVRLRLLWKSDDEHPTPFHHHDGSGRLAWGRVVWSFIAPVLVAALAAWLLAECGLHVGERLLLASKWHLVLSHKFMVLAIPIVIAVMMLSSTLLTGLLTHIEQEEEREWWARAGGLLVSCLLIWVGLNCVAFYAAVSIHHMYGLILGVVGLGAGYIGSAAGLSAATTSGLKRVKAEQLTKFEKFLADHGMIAPFASGTALVCIALALATLTGWLRLHLRLSLVVAAKSQEPWLLQHYFLQYFVFRVHPKGSTLWTLDHLKRDFLATLSVFGAACLVAFLANKFVNINTFSLHGMYRMRLTRAYLGASNFARHPNSFTNFDSSDNTYEGDMLNRGAPLHIVNAALNLVATRNMAWQQRKAEPFTFSPISVGSWRVGYVPTEEYGGTRGVTVGTAMAISGAAFNPNMGYHSSPLVTLLMTFFNARLGWWLPNPIWPHLRKWPVNGGPRYFLSRRSRFLGRNGPQWALMPLLNEALGNTDDCYKWIELSDGGHFENLGLYEMVLRRCRRIIVVDADADGEFQFEDLGNAVRKIEIDLGIPITFPDFPHGLPMKKGAESENVYCIRGVIQYSCVDYSESSGELLFIKPVLNGSEPPDIRAYAAAHQHFPHEATSNQFFNEAQFESYRHLGSWMISSYCENAPDRQLPTSDGCDIDTFFACVKSACNANRTVAEDSVVGIGLANPIILPAGET